MLLNAILTILLICCAIAAWRWHVLVTTTISQLVTSLRDRGIRVFEVTLPERIGHFAGEPELWLKKKVLDGTEHTPTVLVASPDQVANPHLLTYWEEKFAYTISPTLWRRLQKLFPACKQLTFKNYDVMHAIDGTAGMYDIYARWGDRPPPLELRSEDKDHGLETLKKWGLKDGDWFVCVHNREQGYSPSDDHYHEYRNSALDTIIPAMREIVARGGWVIRMGDPSMTPLPPMEHVIDYAHSPLRSARLDIILCATARFFLGNTSGLFGVSTVFGVPVASANFTPISAMQFTKHDLSIPKLLYVTQEKRLLTFAEAFASPAANYRFSEQYEKEGLLVKDNSAEDIVDLTVEMLERVMDTCTYTAHDEELQQAFRAFLKPGHYAYGSVARTGRNFLRKNEELFQAHWNIESSSQTIQFAVIN